MTKILLPNHLYEPEGDGILHVDTGLARRPSPRDVLHTLLLMEGDEMSVCRLEMVEGCWLSALSKASTSRSNKQSSSGKENWRGAGVSEVAFPRSLDFTRP
jgi:hypothetical protein